MEKEIPIWMGRTRLLLGDQSIHQLRQSHVLVVGLGGVGAVAAEMIARGGVGKMTIVDADTVEASNRNRQLPALLSTENQLKAEILGKRLMDINPELQLQILPIYLKDENIHEVLNAAKYDVAVDAIDTLSSKVFFIKACLEKAIPLFSSMGAGGRVDPSMVRTGDISESYNCNLAKDVRKRLHKLGIRKGFQVVYSPEAVDKTKLVLTPDDMRKKSVIGTISYMPAIFGCHLASMVLRKLSKQL